VAPQDVTDINTLDFDLLHATPLLAARNGVSECFLALENPTWLTLLRIIISCIESTQIHSVDQLQLTKLLRRPFFLYWRCSNGHNRPHHRLRYVHSNWWATSVVEVLRNLLYLLVINNSYCWFFRIHCRLHYCMPLLRVCQTFSSYERHWCARTGESEQGLRDY
jgi:hypothetical protein